MKIVATYDMILNLGSGPEPVLRGQEIEPPGTGVMNRNERARSLIGQGAAVLPEAWPKHRDRTEAKYQATQKMVEQAQRDTERAIDAKRKAAEERAKAKDGAA